MFLLRITIIPGWTKRAEWCILYGMNYKVFMPVAALAALSSLSVLPSCTYSRIVNRQEDGLATLSQTLSGVNDKASADAAAAAVRNYGSLLMGDVKTITANGRPSLIELLMLKNSYQNSSLKQQSKACLSQVFRIAAQRYYGSDELRSAFVQMLRSGK